MKKITLLTFLLVASIGVRAQVTATPPDPIILCDVNNPGDQIEVFDLTIREAQIINGQTNVVVSYHETSGDALGNGGFIANPTAYINMFNPQIIFIRVENVNNPGDWEVTTLDIIVPLIPEVVEQPDNLVIQESNSDGFASFDLTQNESQALGAQDPFLFQFRYFETQQDAENNVNSIVAPEDYTNTINPQLIYVRMMPLQEDCDFEIYNFEIRVEEALLIKDVKTPSFEIYPNPANNEIKLKLQSNFDSGTIEIFDVLGKKILNQKLNAAAGLTEVNISQMSSGMYLIKITSNGISAVKKLIKK